MGILGLVGVPKYYKGRLSEKIKVEPGPFNQFSKYESHYRSECTGSAFQEFPDSSSRVILERLDDVLEWCSKNISKKYLYQEYLVMQWMFRYVNYALPTAYLNKSRLNEAMEGKNIIRNRTPQEEKNIESFMRLAKLNRSFPSEDWDRFVSDAEVKDKMSKTREEVRKKFDKVVKLMPKKKVVTYEIDFKNCAGYTEKVFEV